MSFGGRGSSVACPLCGAARGQRCVNGAGREVASAHAERLRAVYAASLAADVAALARAERTVAEELSWQEGAG